MMILEQTPLEENGISTIRNLSFGLSEFRKKWGKRKLEDDWRRSNKKTLNTFDGDSTTLDKINKQKNQDLKSEQYYLDQIPPKQKRDQQSLTQK